MSFYGHLTPVTQRGTKYQQADANQKPYTVFMNPLSAAPVPAPLLVDLFAAIDRMDANGFAAYFTPTAEWKFGNADPITGREAIAATAQSVFNVLTRISHALTQTYQTPDGFITWGDVTYHRIDGNVLVIPFAGFFSVSNNQITRYQTFIDGSPLFAGLGAA